MKRSTINSVAINISPPCLGADRRARYQRLQHQVVAAAHRRGEPGARALPDHHRGEHPLWQRERQRRGHCQGL